MHMESTPYCAHHNAHQSSTFTDSGKGRKPAVLNCSLPLSLGLLCFVLPYFFSLLFFLGSHYFTP